MITTYGNVDKNIMKERGGTPLKWNMKDIEEYFEKNEDVLVLVDIRLAHWDIMSQKWTYTNKWEKVQIFAGAR